jgi:hypothetical protein
LKKDLNTAERKLAERKERIVNLERLVAQSENQLRMKEQEFQRVSKELNEQLTAAHTREQAFSSGGAIGFGRIAKPLRGEFVCNHRQNMRLKVICAGGGGGNVPAPVAAGGLFGANSASPLSRLAGEESGSGESTTVIHVSPSSTDCSCASQTPKLVLLKGMITRKHDAHTPQLHLVHVVDSPTTQRTTHAMHRP